MAEYLSFEDVASELNCSGKKVRQLVLEDRRLKATRMTPNGAPVPVGSDEHAPYDLSLCDHVSDAGEITSDIYGPGANGQTELKRTLVAGYLRVERADLDRFIVAMAARPTGAVGSTFHVSSGGIQQTLPSGPVALAAVTAQVVTAPAQATGASSPTTEQVSDPERRLAKLIELGGSIKYKHGEWKIRGITALMKAEKAEGRKRCAEKTIRGDLKEAAQAERDARRAGFGDGLGQR